jgi:hypothetical protein
MAVTRLERFPNALSFDLTVTPPWARAFVITAALAFTFSAV